MDESCLVIFLAIVNLVVIAFAAFGFAAFIMNMRRRDDGRKLETRLRVLERQLRIFAESRATPPVAETSPDKPPPAQTVDAPSPVEFAPKPQPSAASPSLPTAPPAPPTAPPPPATPPSRPASENWEEIIGKRWMTYAGALVLFLAAGFFIKYAFDSGYVGPTARVLLGLVAGIAVIVAGDRFIRRSMPILGQGMLGLGLAVIFLSTFAAHGLYDLVPRELAFVGLIGAVALGMTLAVLHEAVVIAFLAVLGGLLTPVLLSTGVNSRDALYAYLILLDLAVLGVAFFRRWRALDVLAFVGTYALFFGWYLRYYDEPQRWATLAWLAAFYLVFLILPFVNHFRHGTKIKVERFIMAMANAVIAFVFAYAILHPEHDFTLGFVVLVMAACYLALGILTRRRIAGDPAALFGFVALAVVFLTMTVPLHLRLNGITLAWAVEGPVLIYLGYRFRYLPARLGGAAVFLVAAGRLLFTHSTLHTAYFTLFLNAKFGSALIVVASAFALAIVHRAFRSQAEPVDTVVEKGGLIAGGLIAAALVGEEIAQFIEFFDQPFVVETHRSSWPARSLVWAVAAALYTQLGWLRRDVVARVFGLVLIAVAAVLAYRCYFIDWPKGFIVFANLRFLPNFVALFVFGWYLHIARRRPKEEVELGALPWLFGVFLLWLLVILSTEIYRFTGDTITDTSLSLRAGQLSLTITWAAYAIALLVVGFWKRWRPLRLAALGLFGVTLAKLVLVDMAGLTALYRILAFFCVGVLMMGASYLYHLVEKRLNDNPGEA
ncbi:MAG: DUF2339 domain-containing protein [Candidatus Lernaella stagnicola]|nr:DUF2339 domain-containing protein [Candidatus Lernaella stagnicola]